MEQQEPPAEAGWQALEAIRQVKARYFRLVDAKDWNGLAQVFTPDARFDRGCGSSARNPVTGEWPGAEPQPDIVEGREEVIAMIRRAVEHLWTIHQGFMPELTLLGSDNAEGIWAMSDDLRGADGRRLFLGRGHYHDTYRREQGVWRIASSRLTRLHIEKGN
ncbi:nuclear transport factor 2 family protein [Novosphingobium sp. BL-8H]|uniref:nuclear transport factor 2 family protein n=1 Tax=Novosphingobium sp. BL-8H TaxID=3127640 RepID=UPI0037578A93